MIEKLIFLLSKGGSEEFWILLKENITWGLMSHLTMSPLPKKGEDDSVLHYVAAVALMLRQQESTVLKCYINNLFLKKKL